jgi:acyl-coenzyme A thioesterase PaaI-like protein
VRAVRSRPLTRGRTSQVWEGTVEDAAGKLVARGTVRLLCVAAELPLGEGQ